MADVTVCDLVTGDRKDWSRLWSEWQRHMAGAVPEVVTEKTWKLLLDDASGLHGLIARNSEGQALGFAHVSLTPFAWTGGNVLYLQDLFVRAGARGQGTGATLLDAVYLMADRRGAAQVFWMVDEDNHELQRFYASHAVRSPYTRYMRKAWDW